jgi:hypothetical protein
MQAEYLAAIYNRVRIGGRITPADVTLLTKDLIMRMDSIEEKLNEVTKTRTTGSKVSKTKTTPA